MRQDNNDELGGRFSDTGRRLIVLTAGIWRGFRRTNEKPAWCFRAMPCFLTRQFLRIWHLAYAFENSQDSILPRKSSGSWPLCACKAFRIAIPGNCPGGQQQRVALARALIIEPEILLLDEPLSNLDAKLRQQMRVELLEILRDVGTTSILVTHDQEEALALADRVAVMNDGRLEQVGPPAEIYENRTTPFVAKFLGESNTLPGVIIGSRGGLHRVRHRRLHREIRSPHANI